MGTFVVPVILAVIFVPSFRSTAKEMKKGGCAYCASAMKEAHLEGEMTSALLSKSRTKEC